MLLPDGDPEAGGSIGHFPSQPERQFPESITQFGFQRSPMRFGLRFQLGDYPIIYISDS
jgi:hypothetical protein